VYTLVLRAAVPLALVALLTAADLRAPEEPFPACPDDRALLYFVDETTQKASKLVFLDQEPLGYVTGRSFFNVIVRPGTYLLWGAPAESEWLELKAGRTYLLVIDPRHDIVEPVAVQHGTTTPAVPPTRTMPAGWRVDDPGTVRERIEALDLTQLFFDEADRARLRKKMGRRKHEKALNRAAAFEPTPLPATFERVVMRGKRQSYVPRSLQQINRGGRLTVDQSGIVYEAGKESLEIPIDDILRLEGSRDEDRIRLGLLHGPPDRPDEVFFLTPSHTEHNRIVLAVLDAIAARR
jgi:hypothetical protein